MCLTVFIPQIGIRSLFPSEKSFTQKFVGILKSGESVDEAIHVDTNIINV